jgi:predicted HicB family RNase H-like nuclease
MNPKLGIDRGARLGVRLPDSLVTQAKAAAKARGESLTALIQRALERELDRLEREKGQQ